MNKQIISSSLAIKAKELGCEEPSLFFYDMTGKEEPILRQGHIGNSYNKDDAGYISAYNILGLVEWLQKEYSVIVTIQAVRDYKDDTIFPLQGFSFFISTDTKLMSDNKIYKTMNNAFEGGIDYAFNFLNKNKNE